MIQLVLGKIATKILVDKQVNVFKCPHFAAHGRICGWSYQLSSTRKREMGSKCLKQLLKFE